MALIKPQLEEFRECATVVLNVVSKLNTTKIDYTVEGN